MWIPKLLGLALKQKSLTEDKTYLQKNVDNFGFVSLEKYPDRYLNQQNNALGEFKIETQNQSFQNCFLQSEQRGTPSTVTT